MQNPFEYKITDYLLVAASAIPAVAPLLLGHEGMFSPLLNWCFAGILAYIVRDSFATSIMGNGETAKHAFALSWATMALVINLTLINFPDNDIAIHYGALLSFTYIFHLMLKLWKCKVAPLEFILSGLILGILSQFYPNCLLWLILFPLITYQMRSFSGNNLGALATGVILSIWFIYLFRFIVWGEDNADGMFAIYINIFTEIIPIAINFNIFSILFTSLLIIHIIIYNILPVPQDKHIPLKVHFGIFMLKVMSFVIIATAVFDLSHLPNYICFLSVFLSYQLGFQHTWKCFDNCDWYSVIMLCVYAVLCIFTLLYSSFLQ